MGGFFSLRRTTDMSYHNGDRKYDDRYSSRNHPSQSKYSRDSYEPRYSESRPYYGSDNSYGRYADRYHDQDSRSERKQPRDNYSDYYPSYKRSSSPGGDR